MNIIAPETDYTVVDNNPSQTFNNYSPTIIDETLNDLRRDIITLDDSLNNDLSVSHAKPSTSELAIREMYKRYSEKLGITVGFSDFKQYIANIADNNKIQRDILEAINAKLAMDISQRVIAKLLLTMQQLIDRSTAMILRQTESKNAEFTPELVGMVDKCMQWTSQLNDMVKDASAKCADPDRAIARIMEKVKQEVATERANGNTKDNMEIINVILDKLKM